VVAQAGVIDLREAARLNLSNGAAASLLGGSPGKLPRRYDLASPIERLPLGVPQLLVHGDADDSVPLELSRRYAQRAREAGDPCELVELPGCGHFEHLDPSSHAWGVVTDWLERR
jgi:pimeloyl-ACP methyl ester carboxylesterase